MRIATALVDRTGVALMADDFETMHRHQILPQPIETFEGRKFVTTTEQMRRIFFSLRSHHKAMNVTHIRREVTSARFVDAKNIDTVYFSYLYSGQTLVQEPYPSYAVEVGEIDRINVFGIDKPGGSHLSPDMGDVHRLVM